jgi:hypothetical protein
MKPVFLGSIKSGISSVCGLVLSLNIVDPEHFNLAKLGGLAHLGEACLVVLIVSEARYWKDWADAVGIHSKPDGPAS